MKTRIGVLAALAIMLACAPAAAASITVNVRIEGLHHTVFDRNIKTAPHMITKDATGSHPCNGLNNGANSKPGPTVHSALDDASKVGGFTWAATWSTTFDDFFVTRIGPDTGTNVSFWAEAVNFKDTTAGGCQVELKPGDQVLFYFVKSTSPKYLLKLSGPHTAQLGEQIRVHVVDGQTGKPVQGASVRGQKSNAHGYVKLRFDHTGLVELRATMPGALRSNFVGVRVQ